MTTINYLQTALTQTTQHWLTTHLNVEWLMANPLATFGLVCLVFFLGLGLLSAIARLTESIWLFAARLPWQLVRWLLGLVAKTWQIPLAGLTLIRQPKPVEPSDGSLGPVFDHRVTEILTRLTTLQKEQDQLTQELSRLLVKGELGIGDHRPVEVPSRS